MAKLRLDRMLCELGIGTRSQLRDVVKKGRVSVDGLAVKDPGLNVDPERQEIRLDGALLQWQAVHTVMLNKPCGVLTAARDPKQKTVMDLLPPLYASSGCMPAGRLDKDTSGMLILTNDGQLAHRLITPGKEVGKQYEAELDGPLGDDDIAAFAAGLPIHDADGAFTAKPAKLTILMSAPDKSVARVLVTEGKYHQVRRMFAARGRTVVKLRRVAIGALPMDECLAPGAWRELTQEEIRLLETAP